MNKNEPHYTHTDYEIVQRDILYDSRFRLVRLHLRYKLFNGRWSPIIKRMVLERPSAAAVLPYDPVLDRVILIEQFRPGALQDEISPWQLEIPAGILEGEEEPQDLAVRETQEEAGCDISNVELIYKFFVSPGGSTEYIHVFWGIVDASNIEGVHGLPEENEDIRVLNIPANDAFDLVRQHKIQNSPAIIALQWLELNREKIRVK